METYISLDIETTGFDPVFDEAIEIGAVKYKGNELIEKFHTLLNPGTALPPMVTHITGLQNEDIKDAPYFSDIKNQLSEFLQDIPIIGHNIAFDIGFLNSKGLKIKNTLYDTCQLAMIFLAGYPSYSLDTLSRILKIKHEQKHRAVSDAEAAYKLFLILKKKLIKLDTKTYEEIKKLIQKSGWSLKNLFLEVQDIGTNKNEIKNIKTISVKPQFKISNDEIKKLYEKNSLPEKILPEDQKNKQQDFITNTIINAFKKKAPMLIEAGIGTGKIPGYLTAAIMISRKEKEPVIIATYSQSVQTHIIKKYLPILKKDFQQVDNTFDFKISILKKQKSYLSLERFNHFKNKNNFLEHEISVLIKILVWLEKTENGNLEELALQGKEFSVLEEICCKKDLCSHGKNTEDCYFEKAKKNAAISNLIIMNQQLLLEESCIENEIRNILEASSYYIIDEADQLEKVAREILSISLSFNIIARPFEKIIRQAEELEIFSSPIEEINTLLSRIEIFFGLLGIFMEKNLYISDFQYQLILKKNYLQGIDWNKIKTAAENLQMINENLNKKLAIYEQNLPQNEYQKLKNNIETNKKNLENLKTAINENETHLTWLLKNPEGNIILKSTPLDIGKFLQEKFSNKHIILTSTNLTDDPSFYFIRQQLNLDENWKYIQIPAFLEKPGNIKILIPDDLPDTAGEGYFLECCSIIKKIIKNNKGKSFILFQSKKAISAAYNKLAPEMKKEGLTILAQGISGGKGKILEYFKDDPENCALFGTEKFWDEIELKNSYLNCLIMQKLPFDYYEDPFIFAQSQKFQDNFSQFHLPAAVLKFKKIFHRLIYNSKTNGKIIILDSRIYKKPYGKEFLGILPEGVIIEKITKEKIVKYFEEKT